MAEGPGGSPPLHCMGAEQTGARELAPGFRLFCLHSLKPVLRNIRAKNARKRSKYLPRGIKEIPAPAWEALEPHISGAGSTWTRLPLCWVLPAPMGAPAPCAGCCSHGRMSIWWYRRSANESTNRRFQRLIGQPNVCAAPRGKGAATSAPSTAISRQVADTAVGELR